MDLLRFLFKGDYRVALLLIVSGIVSGGLGAGLVAAINHALHATTISALVVSSVLALALAKAVSSTLATWFLVRYAQQIVLDLSISLCRKILAAPFRQLEEMGGHRLLTSLTTDVPVLTSALLQLPSLAINLAVVIGIGVYLLWLFPAGFGALALVLAGGMLFYAFLHRQAFRAISLSREHRDGLMQAFRGITDGLKELKMSRARRNEFLDRDVEGAAARVKYFNLIATRKYLMLDGWSQVLFYFMIASVLLLFPRNAPQAPEVLSGYVFAALYVMAPIRALIGTIPTFLNGSASIRKINALGITLVEEPIQETKPVAPKSVCVQLEEVEFAYSMNARGDDDFQLGPIDLSLEPGKVIFVVGGNGSGKTTLIKVLTGLYMPTSGAISVDGKIVATADYDWYREHFSIVFSDFFLFDRLLGATGTEIDETANRYLAELGLADRVRVNERTFSKTNLSHGQRKRLALLTALIEARPICVFDEWAADQDPHYKEFFYVRLLPKLKAEGRAVVVVTHDDRYFRCADQVIRLENGLVRPATAAERRFETSDSHISEST